MDELQAAGPAPSRSVLAAQAYASDGYANSQGDDSRRSSSWSEQTGTQSTNSRQASPGPVNSASNASGSRRGSKESVCSTGSANSVTDSSGQRREHTRRRNKAHVSTACFPCKRAHLACETTRPCRRCINLDRTEQCIDVAHKRRGRPRIKDTAAKSGPPRDLLNHFQASTTAPTSVQRHEGPQMSTEARAGQPQYIDIQQSPRHVGCPQRNMPIGGSVASPGTPNNVGTRNSQHAAFNDGKHIQDLATHAFNLRPIAPDAAAMIVSMDLTLIRTTDEMASWLHTSVQDLVNRSLLHLTLDEDVHKVTALQQSFAQEAADELGIQFTAAQQLDPRALQDALARHSFADLSAAGVRPSSVRTIDLSLRQAHGGSLPLTASLWLGAMSASTFPYIVMVVQRRNVLPITRPSVYQPQPTYHHIQEHIHPYQQRSLQPQPVHNVADAVPVEESKKPLTFLDPGFDWASVTKTLPNREENKVREVIKTEEIKPSDEQKHNVRP